MALKGRTATTFTYNSVIGDVPVVNMYANIPETGETSRNKNIQDYALYEVNKEECRADMEAFDRMVDAAEDQISTQNSKEGQ